MTLTEWYREVRNPPSIKAEIELLRFMVDCSDVNLDFEQSELLGPVWLRFWFKIIQDDYPNAKDRETMQSFIIKTMLPDRGLRNAAGCTMLTQTLRSLAMVVREESYCIPIKGGYCCAQHTGVHRIDGSNCLDSICLPEEKTSIYARPTFATPSPPLRHLATWGLPS